MLFVILVGIHFAENDCNIIHSLFLSSFIFCIGENTFENSLKPNENILKTRSCHSGSTRSSLNGPAIDLIETRVQLCTLMVCISRLVINF